MNQPTHLLLKTKDEQELFLIVYAKDGFSSEILTSTLPDGGENVDILYHGPISQVTKDMADDFVESQDDRESASNYAYKDYRSIHNDVFDNAKDSFISACKSMNENAKYCTVYMA